MVMKTFTWPTQPGDTPDIGFRTRSSQFGNGYKQVVVDGPNNKEESYPITYTGPKAKVREIAAFLDEHAGGKSFLWTTPLGDLGIYRCDKYAPTPMGGTVFRITATFEQAPQP